MSYQAPYQGLRVVDLSQGIAGPYAAMLLAQYGADVIKVEPPEGDWARILGVRYGDQTVFSIAGNLGKRSIAVDLKTDEGREIVRRLIAGADVFLEGFRPAVAARLGIGYDDVAAINPGIIYVSISGFGQSGPESQRPAMDPILQAFTGLIANNRGPDGIPHRVTPIVGDMSTALYTFQALSAAIYARRDEPRGCYGYASLLQSAAKPVACGPGSHREEVSPPPTASCSWSPCTRLISGAYATRSSCPMCPTIRASLPAICATRTSRSSWQRCPRGSDATPLPSSRGDSVRPGSCTRGSTTISSSFAILTWRQQASSRGSSSRAWAACPSRERLAWCRPRRGRREQPRPRSISTARRSWPRSGSRRGSLEDSGGACTALHQTRTG